MGGNGSVGLRTRRGKESESHAVASRLEIVQGIIFILHKTHLNCKNKI